MYNQEDNARQKCQTSSTKHYTPRLSDKKVVAIGKRQKAAEALNQFKLFHIHAKPKIEMQISMTF